MYYVFLDASLKDIESIRHSVRPSRVIYEVVASDEPPYFQPKQKKRLVDIPKHYGPE